MGVKTGTMIWRFVSFGKRYAGRMAFWDFFFSFFSHFFPPPPLPEGVGVEVEVEAEAVGGIVDWTVMDR